jgi:hypothetical protein
MKLLDANILLYAYNRDSAHHEVCRTWLEEAFNGSEPVALPWQTLLAFIRIATSPRISTRPLSATGLRDCGALARASERHRRGTGRSLLGDSSRADRGRASERAHGHRCGPRGIGARARCCDVLDGSGFPALPRIEAHRSCRGRAGLTAKTVSSSPAAAARRSTSTAGPSGGFQGNDLSPTIAGGVSIRNRVLADDQVPNVVDV